MLKIILATINKLSKKILIKTFLIHLSTQYKCKIYKSMFNQLHKTQFLCINLNSRDKFRYKPIYAL